ncbi:P-type conjugative transfer protein TrbL [Vreelandella alkaliphila]|uniref:P-type conjugative transfer protein TrbL n=1 Tax=Vreelandella alkaliphila TaxID=272774 RepID=UPI003FD78DF1
MSKVCFRLVMLLVFLLVSQSAWAEIEPDGVLDDVADRFLTASSLWGATIVEHATWLFWTLVLISMVWTFGMMALRKADIGEFFAELVRFIIFTGFFWWLLMNGPYFAMSIIDSLRTMGATAGGLDRELTPSEPISIAFDIIVKSAKSYSFTSPIDNLSIFLITLAILACMAVVSANVLLALVNAWILAYAGVFVLGFGGSRWTSDIAINYFRSVLGIALKLLTMTLLIGVAISIMDGYYSDLSENVTMRELMVVFVVALVLVVLIHSVPNMIAGLVPGGGGPASASGSLSAGALVGGAIGAGATVASGGAALGGAAMSGATNVAGGASAIKAAFEKAQATSGDGAMAGFAGSDISPGMGSVLSSGSESGSDAGSFAEAAGFANNDSAGSSGFGRAASMAAGTTGELAKGIGSKVAGSFQAKVSQTAGGRLASSIREGMGQSDGSAQEQKSDATGEGSNAPSFGSNSLGGSDQGGWVNQTGGFDSLSSEDQNKARQSHAEWQARDPEKHTFDVGAYVSYTQERQQERDEEVTSFVNRDQ